MLPSPWSFAAAFFRALGSRPPVISAGSAQIVDKIVNIIVCKILCLSTILQSEGRFEWATPKFQATRANLSMWWSSGGTIGSRHRPQPGPGRARSAGPGNREGDGHHYQLAQFRGDPCRHLLSARIAQGDLLPRRQA